MMCIRSPSSWSTSLVQPKFLSLYLIVNNARVSGGLRTERKWSRGRRKKICYSPVAPSSSGRSAVILEAKRFSRSLRSLRSGTSINPCHPNKGAVLVRWSNRAVGRKSQGRDGTHAWRSINIISYHTIPKGSTVSSCLTFPSLLLKPRHSAITGCMSVQDTSPAE